MSIRCTVVIQQEDDWYIAKCVENSVASQGCTMEEALANLNEAIALYYEDNDAELPQSPVFVTTMEVAI